MQINAVNSLYFNPRNKSYKPISYKGLSKDVFQFSDKKRIKRNPAIPHQRASIRTATALAKHFGLLCFSADSAFLKPVYAEILCPQKTDDI